MTSPLKCADELNLWRRFKQGDQEAFAEIYSQYAGILFNYGYHIVADASLVQDAIQDLFVDLWRMHENLSDTTSIKFYLFRALRRKLHRLTDRGQMFSELPLIATSDIPTQEMEMIMDEESSEKLQMLQRHLLDLPPRQLEAIRLRFYENSTLEQIASVMEMNEQSVRNLIQRAIHKLRSKF